MWLEVWENDKRLIEHLEYPLVTEGATATPCVAIQRAGIATGARE